MLKIINKEPPMLDEIMKAFPEVDLSMTVFTFGSELYNPSGSYVSDDLMAHEEVHEYQQACMTGGPTEWWKRYIDDRDFRLAQELEAYKRQFDFSCRKITDRNKQAVHLMKYARILAHPMYRLNITPTEEYHMIRKCESKNLN